MLALRARLPWFGRANLMLCRTFGSAAVLAVKQLPPRPKIEEADIEENFLKGSGPGGQKINKTASAVQLLHKPTGIVVKSQATRSRIQNRKIARQLLAEKLEVIDKGDESRKKIKEGLKSKRKRSSDKKSRRKYRKLAEGKEGDGDGDEVEGEDEMEDEEEDITLKKCSENGGDANEQRDDPGNASREESPRSDVEEKMTK